MDEEFGNEFHLIKLGTYIKEQVKKKEIKAIAVQIDSTKRPCKICTIDIVQNTLLEDGYIYKFFKLFPEIQDDKKVVVVSWHEPYDEEKGYDIATENNYKSVFKDSNDSPKIYITEIKDK